MKKHKSKFRIVKPEYLFLLAALAVIFSSCKKDHLFDCFKSTGKTITTERTASPFNKIDMANDVNLIFNKQNNYSLKVTAGANLIDGITTEITDSTLYIKNENKCNWVRDFNNEFTIEIAAPELVFVNNTGTGDITFNDTNTVYEFRYDNFNASGTVNLKLNCDRFHVNIHTGTADVSVSGFCGLNLFYYNGYGYMNFKNLITRIVYINNQGIGDCRIHVIDDLHAEIKYIGNIYYSGSPQVLTADITGTGLLIHE